LLGSQDSNPSINAGPELKICTKTGGFSAGQQPVDATIPAQTATDRIARVNIYWWHWIFNWIDVAIGQSQLSSQRARQLYVLELTGRSTDLSPYNSHIYRKKTLKFFILKIIGV
jgi:hypothetical protein